MTYASCRACGWRGVTHNFDSHVCNTLNGYVADRSDLQSGWPDDRTTWEKLRGRALDAINPLLAPHPVQTFTWDELLGTTSAKREP